MKKTEEKEIFLFVCEACGVRRKLTVRPWRGAKSQCWKCCKRSSFDGEKWHIIKTIKHETA